MANLGRLEGRLFAEDGCLFMVVGVDELAGTARVTCRLDGRTRVVELPLEQVAGRVAASATLGLDDLHGPRAARRIVQENEGWHFATREGLIGPHGSEEEAASALARYVLAVQSAPVRPAPPFGGTPNAPRRRASDRLGRPPEDPPRLTSP